MMKKTGAILILLYLLINNPLAWAEDKHVLIVKSMSVPIIDTHVELFEKHLKHGASRESVNYTTRIINAEGSQQTLRSRLKEAMDEEAPDLIVTSATLATREVFSYLKEKPDSGRSQVYFTVTDPWGTGVIDGTSTVSGVPYYLPSEIKMNIAQRLVKHRGSEPFTIGFVYSSYPSAVSDLERVRTAAAEANVGFRPLKIEYKAVGEHLQSMLNEVQAKAIELDGTIDYWWLAKGPLGERPETVAALAEISNKPVLYGNGLAAVKRGAVFFAGVSNEESMKISADLALEFLLNRPHSPENQAVMGQSYELFFNLKAATAAGITIPSDLLDMALKNSGIVGD